MYNLLVDIGNSNVKIGRGNRDNVKLLKHFSYGKETFITDFQRALNFLKNDNNTFCRAGISILKKANEKFLSVYFTNTYNLLPVFISQSMKDLPIKIRYSRGLGNDRICNAVAARMLYRKKNILIIDFGTATTYTLVSNDTLIGGMISPGIETSLKALTENTTLPEVNLSFPKELINSNTLDNIKAGILYQSLFSLEKTILHVRKKFKDLFAIATGGYSGLVAKRTLLVDTIDRNLVLKGINILISK